MAADSHAKAVLFGLGYTLCDTNHSWECALREVQKDFPSLETQTMAALKNADCTASRLTYPENVCIRDGLNGVDVGRVLSFFKTLGLPRPSVQEIRHFLTTYKKGYMTAIRATARSVETLVRLRENGYRLVIVTNGRKNLETEKAQAIGVARLVDHIVTSQEAGYDKPGSQIFARALSVAGALPSTACMVGASVKFDIRGALNTGLMPVLYQPLARHSVCFISETRIPIISHMSQLLDHLHLPIPKFKPSYRLKTGHRRKGGHRRKRGHRRKGGHRRKRGHRPKTGQFVIDGLGIDLVTAYRPYLEITRETVQFIVSSVKYIIEDVSNKEYTSAMSRLVEVIKAVAEVSPHIDEDAIKIEFPGLSNVGRSTVSNCQIVEREDSIRATHAQLSVAGNKKSRPLLWRITQLWQAHCDDLMRGYSRGAITFLGLAILSLADAADIRDETSITGIFLDELTWLDR